MIPTDPKMVIIAGPKMLMTSGPKHRTIPVPKLLTISGPKIKIYRNSIICSIENPTIPSLLSADAGNIVLSEPRRVT